MNYLNIKSAVIRAMALLAVAVFVVGGIAIASAQSNCITFESPLAGSVIPEMSCTISLNVECRNVTKVDLQARYIPEHSDSPMIVSLGTISRPPYKLIWNTYNLQNQLFTGIGILAEAAISGGAPQVARQEGIFLTHKSIDRKMIEVPYLPSGAPAQELKPAGKRVVRNSEGLLVEDSIYTYAGAEVQKFNGIVDPQKSAWGAVIWNEKELIFQVYVTDPSFYSKQPGKDLADAGLEIMIDPTRKRAPYPTDRTIFIVVPLEKVVPYAVNYRAEIADGAFKPIPKSTSIDYPYNVGLSEFKGYNIRASVPKEAFGKSMPDTISCNMALRLLDADGKVQKVSLTGSNVYEMYSPFSWNDYYRTQKPLFMNSALQWGIFSAIGFLIALAVYALVSKLRKPQLLSNFERSEEAKAVFERVNAVIEQELIKKDLKIDYVANKCGMDQQSLNTLIKRNTGFNFINYLQYCRSEVAKERLRSSRSSETSIADLCGFDSAIEMEKCFGKFYHTTPYKFRTQQQVA
ncbi:MAG: AraC family transcriptional regulator [Chitinispirillales bacterium]|jgi:AraC-like DNA-binding protein|nr:AraC family transcriptional regulator [Chitinispirillales bacterium]